MGTERRYEMKNGLYLEDGALIYYSNGHPEHAGVIKHQGAIYYISSNGRAVKGQHVVHGEMSNGILKRGTYTFGDDYKLVKGSYIAPKKTKTKSSKKKKAPDKMKIAATLAISLGFVLCISMIVLAPILQNPEITPDYAYVEKPTEEQTVQVELPSFSGEVQLCSNNAKTVYDSGDGSLIQATSPYRAMTFDYRLANCTGTMLLGTSPELSDGVTYVLQEGSHKLPLNNLMTGTTYYYKVQADGQEYHGSFRTAESPRFVSIPGAVNTRDIGGCKTLDGHTVKQGLLIRGSELDGLVVSNYFLSSQNVEAVQSSLKFAFDMDLRSPIIFTGDYQSKLGEDVRHRFYEAPQYGQIFTESSHSALQKIFRDLAKPANYPMYLHGTRGADRTGTVVFLLQGILNMSQEDMIREYQYTGYVFTDYATTSKIEVVIDGMAGYEGETLQEKIVSFLVDEVGVTEEEIESIRDIYLQ